MLGLGIAFTRRGFCAHHVVAGLYIVSSVPVCVALSFMVAYCLTFRSEAQALVTQYAPPALRHPARVYRTDMRMGSEVRPA